MKRIAILILASTLCSLACAQQTSMPAPPRVDRNVELMSIVWRLTGAGEYNHNKFKLYDDMIEDHFGEFKDHKYLAALLAEAAAARAASGGGEGNDESKDESKGESESGGATD
jgi:hypothetical protein